MQRCACTHLRGGTRSFAAAVLACGRDWLHQECTVAVFYTTVACISLKSPLAVHAEMEK